MLVSLLLVAVVLLHAMSATLFFAHLLRDNPRLGSWAVATLAAAFVCQLAFLVLDTVGDGGGWRSGIHTTLALASSLILLTFLLTSRYARIRVLGVFVVPLSLVFFLGSSLTQDAPQQVGTVLLPLHIGFNVLGIVAFALASVVAMAYVVEEYLLRRKRVVGVFLRLPSLEALDSIAIRLVTIGFPLLTLGIATGALWAHRIADGSVGLTAAQSMALLSWAVFGAVLVLRFAAGWRGRRAAVGTLLGFACALSVLAGYAWRSLSGGS